MPRGKAKHRSFGVSRSVSIHQQNVRGGTNIEQAPIENASTEQEPIVQHAPMEEASIEEPPTDHEIQQEANTENETHIENDISTSNETQQIESNRQKNKVSYRKSADGRIYLEPNNTSYHPHNAVRILSCIIKKFFGGPWITWDKTPFEVKQHWFGEFKKVYIWEDRFDNEIHRLYEKFIGRGCLKTVLYNARKTFKEKEISPTWMSEDNWKELQRKYVETNSKKSETNSKNRLSKEETGGEARPSQVFLMTHKKSNSEAFVDKKSKAIWDKFQSEMKESLDDMSDVGAIDSHALENLSNEQEMSIWTKVVGGPKKGRIYGLGSEATNIYVASSQASSHAPPPSQDYIQQMELKIQEEVKKREVLEKELHELQVVVQQLIASHGLSHPCLETPQNVDPSIGSTSAANKDN
ncbi:uncharacterized protein LOC129322538 [Prosopis cineraria]|uniref:uncharacterized protein LOC129322538 n=1 Tax=Prosopis cineraria TaxID=364024 RepID=UPI0024104F07|nr:uncharacterized protein LOC129322538 [Prosopis cineraria]